MRTAAGFLVASILATVSFAGTLTPLPHATADPVPFPAGAGRVPSDTDDSSRHHMPGRPNRGVHSDGGPVFGSTATLYVDDTAPAGGDGASWQTAYRTLRQALLDAENDPTVTEIRVAEGTYRPTAGEGTPDDPQQTDITVVFNMQGQSNLQLLGGFPDGGGDLDDRDPAVHRTILSGDLLGNDVQPVFVEVNSSFTNAADAGLIFYNISDNSQTVLVASGTDDSVVVDGFTIQGGHDPSHGGGLIAINSALEIRNCNFRWNSSTDQGGALFLANGSGFYRLTDCVFENNGTLNNGGAVYVTASDIEIVSSRFVGNDAADGGAVYVTSSSGKATQFRGSTFEHNFASDMGGGIFTNPGSTLDIETSQFIDNAAITQGGAFNTRVVGVIKTSIFDGNRSGVNSNGRGGAIYFETSSNTVTDCVFTNNETGNRGGGAVYMEGNSHVLSDVDFLDNTAVLGPGGALNIAGSSSRLNNAQFERNSAVFDPGGAIYFGSSSHLLRECTFIENAAGLSSDGGAIYFASSTDRIEDSTFLRNNTGRHGGAVYFNSTSNVVERTSFDENTAGSDGGALYGRATIADTAFRNNLAGGDGGGVFSQGVIERSQFINNAASRGGGYAQFNTSNSTIKSTLFASNTASSTGGGVDGFRGTLENCTFYDNYAAQFGGLNSPVSNTITSSIFWENRDLVGSGTEIQQIGPRFQSISYTLIEGLSDHGGNNNIDEDPQFISPLGPDGFANTGDEDFRLMSISPAIDAGLAVETGPVTPIEVEQRDAAGFQRFVAFGGGTDDRRVDMGAFEAQDCDGDGVDDITAIADGLAEDCNGDGLIDGCTNGSFLLGTSARVFPSDGQGSDLFGFGPTDIEGDTLVVGAYRDDDGGPDAGSVYVFARDGAGWAISQKLLSSASSNSDYFGTATALSGDVLAIGANLEDIAAPDAGAVFLFRFDGNQWNEDQVLLASDAASSDYFGFTLAFEGDRLFVGAYFDDNERGTNAGAVYVFEPDNDSLYVQTQKLIADDGGASDYFGYALDADGDDLIIGAYGDNDLGSDSGSAYIFTHEIDSYQQRAKLLASDGGASDLAGYDVAIDGDLAVVGAYLHDNENGSDAGAAYVWTRQGDVWLEGQRLLATDGQASDDFGISVDAGGGHVVIGARDAFHDSNPGAAPDGGAAYIFRDDGGLWVPDGKLIPSRVENSADYGQFVTLRDDVLIVSAYLEDAITTNSGAVYVYETLTSDFNMDGVPDVCGDANPGCNVADYTEPYGLLDLADVLAFVTAFSTADPAGDLDGSGLFDLTDVLLFVNAFTAGCP